MRPLGGVTLDTSDILYVGVSPGTAGLYQVNLRVPINVPNGDNFITLSLGTFTTPSGGYLTVQN